MQNSDDFRILEVDTCESTQSLLSAHAIENAELHAIAISNEQTAGKGQRGNSWVSPKGKGWYFSIYLPHLQIPIFQVQLINWVVSLKLIQALNKIGIDVKAKWPNDIYTLKGKLAGVLIENQISNRQIKSVIIGIGINTEPVEVEGNRPRNHLSFRGTPTARIRSRSKYLHKKAGIGYLPATASPVGQFKSLASRNSKIFVWYQSLFYFREMKTFNLMHELNE